MKSLGLVRVLLLSSIAVAAHLILAAQESRLPKYEVSTVRLNDSGSSDTSINVNGAIFRIGNVTLKQLLQIAWNMRAEQINGMPSWASSDRFDINAKIVDGDPDVLKKLTDDQVRVMSRELITERFHLQSHMETKTLPVYDLVVAKGGVKFKPSSPSDEEGQISSHGVGFTAKNLSTAVLANFLSRQTNRTVIDKTGLTSTYDMSLKWSLEDDSAASTQGNDDVPALFTALEQQLGLKLRPDTGPVPTLVIDHVEHPSGN